MKRGISACLFFLSLFPALPAAAHVRWFVSDADAAACHTDVPAGVIGALLGLAVLVILGAHQLYQRYRIVPSTPSPRWLSVAVGASLLGAAVGGYLATPDHPLEQSMLLTGAEVLCGLSLLTGHQSRWSLAAFLTLATVHDGDFLLDHLGLVGFALFFALQGGRQAAWAWPALRISMGADLVHVGLDEKLLHPALSMAFLHHYHWNFLGCSNELFALGSGTAEVIIGALLALGVFAELAALVVLVLMTVTGLLLGPSELVGHLPYMAFLVGTAWQPQMLAAWRKAIHVHLVAG